MNNRRLMCVPETPAAAALFAMLPPLFRWACDDGSGQRFNLYVPGEVAGKIVATDGRVALWIDATPELSAAVVAARQGVGKFAPATMEGYIRQDDYTPERYTLSLDDLPACTDCGGTGEAEWIECGCCGEKTHTPGVLFPCGPCKGTGADGKASLECGPVTLNPQYAVTLVRNGAVFQVAATDPEKSPVRFVLPDGVTGILMPKVAPDRR